ncbi:alpha/beta hydrolase [Clostridium hydrogeniformans]|uniref:alpha/beta hydrolase n=1 Tax=Clostridium hydrogeniformans TaxID=349933 RepID=UPI000A0008DC|nr:alpha/beta hydrolase-fold protein [Clostridium hydrogeniformans]
MMNKTTIESYKINKLKKYILEEDIHKINEFWTYVEKNHTPIIEEIDGDDDNVIVTFLYKGNEDTKNVVVLSGLSLYDHNLGMMEKLLDTNIWYKSFKARNDLRFDYNLCVNHPLNDNRMEKMKSIVPDPLANHKVIIPRDEENPKRPDIIRNVVELSNADPKKWTISKEGTPKGNIELIRFKSNILNDSYRVWVYTPVNYSTKANPYKTLVLTDGFEYINALNTPTLLDNLTYGKEIPPTVTIFIDSKNNRLKMLSCNENFCRFVTDELMPWAKGNYNISHNAQDSIIAGVSLGGLTAAYLGLNYSNTFGKVLSQSGSFWWSPNNSTKDDYEEPVWMARLVMEKEKLDLKFYLEAGVLENFLVGSMRKVSINMRDTLLSKGYDLKYSEFKGGHDYLSWGETLANGLIYLNK